MRVAWTQAALRQLEAIQDHVAQDSPLAAYRLALELTERTNRNLAEHPLMGRRGRARDTRELILADMSCIIVYRAMRDQLEILAVIHTARNWPESFG